MEARERAKINGQQPVSYTPLEKDANGETVWWGSLGMTKRELFAGMVMQGILAGVVGEKVVRDWSNWREGVTTFSIECADALLEALEVTE